MRNTAKALLCEASGLTPAVYWSLLGLDGAGKQEALS
jgi:hypothetical protein